jgi:hypothetical protein
MRKLVTTTALGCLAMAPAADAQQVRTVPVECAYGMVDRDLVVEIARLDLPRRAGLALA